MTSTIRASVSRAHAGHCRSCHAPGLERVLDLGVQPVADWLVDPTTPAGAEARYPLALDLCRACALLQLAEFPGEEGVDGHVHSSAVSTMIAAHDAAWADEAVARLNLKPGRVVMEAAGGAVAVEFHHAARLLTETQFDLICHPHRTYLSVAALVRAFARHGLTTLDAAEIAVHGGSVRMYACRGAGPVGASVDRVMAGERAVGLGGSATPLRLAEQVETASMRIRDFQIGRASCR